MSKIKIGVVGVGSMGQHHARIYAGLEQVEFAGVYDADGERARKVAAKHGCRAFATLDELLAAVDAASVSAATTAHFELGKKLLEAGKHILMEKPITSTTDEAVQLVELARARDLILQVGHIERFNPVLTALEERLTRPRFIEAHRLSPYPERSTDVSVVLDVMIHDLEIIMHIVRSPVVSLDAVGVPVLSAAEDIANVRLRFASGCVANLTTSRISPEKLRKIRVFQDDAYLSLDYMKQEGEIYRRANGKIVRDKIPVSKDEPLQRQLASFANCVATHGAPIVSGDHSTAALRLAAEIIAQIRAQKLV
ncbi:MAG: Gfo/Idh/MocA family oxidoreductase [Verrucomicrobiales bacterium]|jgi:predicted dehydrogenase|nr:Gfo/Idh/MocA family oxidoreductase [Verrucomicrobiales bacterium]